MSALIRTVAALILTFACATGKENDMTSSSLQPSRSSSGSAPSNLDGMTLANVTGVRATLTAAWLSTNDDFDYDNNDSTSDDSMTSHTIRPPVVLDGDYFFYSSEADLEALASGGSWIDDRAFYPSTVTYGLTFFLGLTGNLLVVVVLLADRKSRNVTSSFMISLAVADVVFLLVCVPYETANKITLYWAGGPILCKLAGFVEMLSALASVLNLTAISIERYVVIVHPMKSRTWCTARSTYKTIAVVWIVAVLLSSPTLYIMNTLVYVWYNSQNHVSVMSCLDSNASGDLGRIIFAWYQLVVMFLLPVVVILFCYTVVIRVLWTSTKEHERLSAVYSSGNNSCNTRFTERSVGDVETPSLFRHSSRKHGNQESGNVHAYRHKTADVSESRKQLMRMLIIIATAFFYCWGPKFVLNVLKKHQVDVLQKDAAFYVYLVLHLLPYVQSCTNPVIYCFMSTRFQRSLRLTCRRCCCCMKRSRDNVGRVSPPTASRHVYRSDDTLSNGNDRRRRDRNLWKTSSRSPALQHSDIDMMTSHADAEHFPEANNSFK